MKIGLLGIGFGQAHAAVYAERSDVDEVIVVGRTPEKLAKISEQFGFATSTDLQAVITDPSLDLVDICLPTRLHADVAVRALQAGHDVLIELPLAETLKDAQRIVTAQQATGRRAFVDMFSRFSPANQYLYEAVADQRYGPLTFLETEGRTALLWPGYDLTLQTLALNMMHADFDLITRLLGRPITVDVLGVDGPAGRGSAAEILLGYPHAIARCTASRSTGPPTVMRGYSPPAALVGARTWARSCGGSGRWWRRPIPRSWCFWSLRLWRGTSASGSSPRSAWGPCCSEDWGSSLHAAREAAGPTRCGGRW
jgi:predicted dehydrogenase